MQRVNENAALERQTVLELLQKGKLTESEIAKKLPSIKRPGDRLRALENMGKVRRAGKSDNDGKPRKPATLWEVV